MIKHLWGRVLQAITKLQFPLFAYSSLRPKNGRTEAIATIGQPIICQSKFGMRALALGVIISSTMGCQNYEPPTDALDCGRQFIDALYDGNFKRVNQLLLPTDANINTLETLYAKPFSQLSSVDRDNLRNASINISAVKDLGNGAVGIRFLNAYTNAPASIRVLQQNGEWKADFAPALP